MSNPASLPLWKQALLENRRKKEELSKAKEMEEENALAAKYAHLPPWKRDLLLKKEAKASQRQAQSTTSKNAQHSIPAAWKFAMQHAQVSVPPFAKELQEEDKVSLEASNGPELPLATVPITISVKQRLELFDGSKTSNAATVSSKEQLSKTFKSGKKFTLHPQKQKDRSTHFVSNASNTYENQLSSSNFSAYSRLQDTLSLKSDITSDLSPDTSAEQGIKKSHQENQLISSSTDTLCNDSSRDPSRTNCAAPIRIQKPSTNDVQFSAVTPISVPHFEDNSAKLESFSNRTDSVSQINQQNEGRVQSTKLVSENTNPNAYNRTDGLDLDATYDSKVNVVSPTTNRYDKGGHSTSQEQCLRTGDSENLNHIAKLKTDSAADLQFSKSLSKQNSSNLEQRDGSASSTTEPDLDEVFDGFGHISIEDSSSLETMQQLQQEENKRLREDKHASGIRIQKRTNKYKYVEEANNENTQSSRHSTESNSVKREHPLSKSEQSTQGDVKLIFPSSHYVNNISRKVTKPQEVDKEEKEIEEVDYSKIDLSKLPKAERVKMRAKIREQKQRQRLREQKQEACHQEQKAQHQQVYDLENSIDKQRFAEQSEPEKHAAAAESKQDDLPPQAVSSNVPTGMIVKSNWQDPATQQRLADQLKERQASEKKAQQKVKREARRKARALQREQQQIESEKHKSRLRNEMEQVLAKPVTGILAPANKAERKRRVSWSDHAGTSLTEEREISYLVKDSCSDTTDDSESESDSSEDKLALPIHRKVQSRFQNGSNNPVDDDDLKVRPADDNGSTSFSQMDINVATLLW